MQKVVEFLQANPVQYLATVGRDGKAKCRPFMFCLEKDGKLWFCTNNQKDVYKDMQENSEIEVPPLPGCACMERLCLKTTWKLRRPAWETPL